VLDSLASSAVVFDAAFSPSSWTLPSHASMFTGRRPFALNTGWNTPLDDRDPTLAERFADAGYATGGFVANLLYTTYESGLSRGFHHYDDHRISAKQVLLTSSPFRNRRTHDLLTARSMAEFRRAIDVLGNMRVRPNISSDRKRAPEVVAEFLDWQSTRDRPFFAFLNLFDAHEPYDAPGPWRTDQASGPTPRDFYDGSIARLDAQIGVLLDSLRRRGVLDNTIVVITSDHGEQFGEHGLRSHGNSLYIQTIHVPLVMLLPDGAGAGRRVRTPVSLTDIGATLLQLARLDQGGFPGRSMQWPDSTDGETAGAPVIMEVRGTGDRVRRDPTFFGPMISVIRGPWHLIRRGDGLEELFDIKADPDEIVDLVSSPAHAGTRDSLAAILDRVR
jgi:arylsulfatase A-like enzyme